MSVSDLQIEELLPHRHPFLFVERITAVESGHSVQGFFRVPGDHPYINRMGGEPVFPAFLLVEALGQVAALCIHPSPASSSAASRPLGYLVRVDHCWFTSGVYADDCVSLSARLLASFGRLHKFEACGEVAGNPVVRAHITLYLER
jgi:3-hydroxyacyl-[acyl-carrier-protein] dehydratase